MNKNKFFSKAAALLNAPSEHDHDLLLSEPYCSKSFRLGRGEIAVLTSPQSSLINNVVTSIINTTSLEAKTPTALITWHMDGLGWLTKGYRQKFSKQDSDFLELTSNEQFFGYYSSFIEALNSDLLTIYDDYISDLFEVFHSCIKAKTVNKALRFIVIDDVTELVSTRRLSQSELTAVFKNLACALEVSIIFLVSTFGEGKEIDFECERSVKFALCQRGWDVNKIEWFASVYHECQEVADISADFCVKLFRPGLISSMWISQPRKDSDLSTSEDLASLSEHRDEFDNDVLSFLELHRKAWSDLKISDIQRLFKLPYSRSKRIFDSLIKKHNSEGLTMSLSNHPVLTQSYPENLTNGVMVCGINFGYSSEDRVADDEGIETTLDRPSFFADPTVNQTRFRNTLIKWLENWGVKFAKTPGELTSNDKSYFQTNWINSQTTSINSDEKISNQTLIESVEPLLGLIRERKPRAIVFVGNILIEAFNDIRIREKVESALGPRSGNAKIHKGIPQKPGARAFKVLTQYFGTTTIICVPHTATQGISYDYMASVVLPAEVISMLNGN